MSKGSKAKDLVILFYNLTKIKYTNTDIMRAVKNTKTLLETFTYEEIEDVIKYCVNNQPPKGIYSYGYITNNISAINAMLKNRKKIEESFDKTSLNNYGIVNKGNKKTDIKKVKNIFDE